MTPTDLPPGFKMKVGFTAKIDGQRCGEIHLMKPRRWLGGYVKVATIVATIGRDTDETIKRRLLDKFHGESDWL